MKSVFSRVLFTVLTFPIAVFADEKITIGRESLTIPIPKGFVRLDGANAEFDQAMKQFVPPKNRLLLTFAPAADVAKIKEGKPTVLGRYGVLQTFAPGENEKITIKDFSQVIEGLEKQMGNGAFATSAQDSANEQLKKAGMDADLMLGDVKMLGVFEKTDRSIDVGILTKVQVGTEAPEPQVAGSSTLVVRGKIAYLYVYSNAATPADTEWVRATVKEWREGILAANPGGTEAGGFNWSSAGEKAVVGGVIGGLAGLVSVFLKKRKAKAAA